MGNFKLCGIKPAPRGVPKLEVTFDLDANGILNVSAKDTNSGNSESIKITSDTRLSKEDIEKMVNEAEKFKQEDKELDEKINLRNQIENIVFSQQFKDIKETNEELRDLENWLENSEIGETSIDEYRNKLEKLRELLDDKDAGIEEDELD